MEVYAAGLTAKDPEQFSIFKNKRFQKYKAKYAA